jgi:hypothetical protein
MYVFSVPAYQKIVGCSISAGIHLFHIAASSSLTVNLFQPKGATAIKVPVDKSVTM